MKKKNKAVRIAKIAVIVQTIIIFAIFYYLIINFSKG